METRNRFRKNKSQSKRYQANKFYMFGFGSSGNSLMTNLIYCWPSRSSPHVTRIPGTSFLGCPRRDSVDFYCAGSETKEWIVLNCTSVWKQHFMSNKAIINGCKDTGHLVVLHLDLHIHYIVLYCIVLYCIALLYYITHTHINIYI